MKVLNTSHYELDSKVKGGIRDSKGSEENKTLSKSKFKYPPQRAKVKQYTQGNLLTKLFNQPKMDQFVTDTEETSTEEDKIVTSQG